jgi:universal stress protein A
MENYRHILLATDFSPHSEVAAQRAYDMAQRHGAELSVLHVVESLPIGDAAYGPIVPFDIDLTDQMLDGAKRRMIEFCQRLEVPDDRQLIDLGSPKAEIIRIAEEVAADLIVLGSHGRHGLALLMGSTASSVIHHAKCDVLAVRLRDV